MAAAVEVDLSKVDRAIKRMLAAGRNLRPVWREIRTPFRKAQAEHIRAQRGPDSEWPALAQSTKAARLGRGGRAGKFTKRGKLRKPVQRKLGRALSARMVSGAKMKLDARAIMIRSAVPWAGIHQHGGIAGRGARIPARPFMYVDDKTIRLTVSRILAHLESSWHRTA
jgi:phage gpG-like protein